MILIWYIGAVLWAKAPDCSDLFDAKRSISLEADLIAQDVFNNEALLVKARPVINNDLKAAQRLLAERREELIHDIESADSIYHHIQYNFKAILKSIDQMGALAERLSSKKDISYEEYFRYFYRLSAVLSFMKTSEVQKIYDNVKDYLRKGDPDYNMYTFSRENFDHFADYALSGKLPINDETNAMLSSSKARIHFIYRMPSLELLSEKMASGVVYATVSTKANSFDGGPVTFPFDLAKHDVTHAARFIRALDRDSIDIQRFSLDNKKILDAAKDQLSPEALQIFWSIHFSRNHEGSYALTYLNRDGKYSWLGLTDKEVLDMLELNSPENWRLTEPQSLEIIKELRRKGFL